MSDKSTRALIIGTLIFFAVIIAYNIVIKFGAIGALADIVGGIIVGFAIFGIIN